MESRTIKISKENYIWLLKIAADMQKRYGESISLDSALNSLKDCKVKKEKLSNLAGSWKMSEKEAEELKKDLRKGWKEWNMQSV